MASSKALTGGTGDVNPQQLFFRVAQTGADVNTETEIPLPVPRGYSSKKGYAIVLELLRSEVLINDLATTVASEVVLMLGTAPGNATNDPATFLIEAVDAVVATAVGFQFTSR